MKLPSAARPALAGLLVPYLPQKVYPLLEGDESWDTLLAKSLNLAHRLDEKAIRECETVLQRIPEADAFKEPEVKIMYVIACTKLRLIQGDFAQAKNTLEMVTHEDFERIIEPHRFKPEFELAQAEAMLCCGDYLAARSLARSVDRYAQQYDRLGLLTRSGILLAHLDFACEDTSEHRDHEQLRRNWNPRQYSMQNARLELLTMWHAFHSHQIETVAEGLSELESRVQFVDALTVRSVHRSYYELKTRYSIYLLLTESRSPTAFDPLNLSVQLRKHVGLPTDLITVVRLSMLYAERKWTEIESFLQGRTQRPLDALAEALCLAIRGAALERTQKGGVRAWQSSLHCLKNAGLALPPEIHHFRPNFERYSERN